MDVNGTKFKLLSGQFDWQQCQEDAASATAPWQNAAWDDVRGAVTLMPALSLFRHKTSAPVDPALRRGAARDEHGNQFWISNDSQSIFWIASADQNPATFWSQNAPGKAKSADQFHAHVPPASTPFTLAGLAVTTHHYLVAGYYGANPMDENGVLIFDLRADGPPIRLIFPAAAAFEPFDMSADADGGVWILDRTNVTYWGLDRQFRIIGSPPGGAAPAAARPAFVPRPKPPKSPVVAPNILPVGGFPIAASLPIGIAALPDGSVLILDTPAAAPRSRLFRYNFADMIGSPIDLVVNMPVVIEGSSTIANSLDVRGYDLAYLAGTTPPGIVYIVEQDGNQVIAFNAQFGAIAAGATFAPLTLSACDAYLPLLDFGDRALITQGTDVYYDVTVVPGSDVNTRWTALQVIDDPRFAQAATLDTPIFDGGTQNCVWHRLFLDACLPASTGVDVWTRAANSLDVLEATAFLPEPPAYQRSAGAEIPYYNPFPGCTDPDMGTYETVFQQAEGQYLQIQLRLSGNGRLTPVLYQLRAYYPRFSYPRQYLPSIYLQDSDSLAFLERFMANPEGFFSDIEGKIDNVSVMFDGRSAPPETLDWLAGWMGLALDPIWQDIQQRRATAAAPALNRCTGVTGTTQPAPDRRRLLIRFAHHLYERRGTLDGLHFALHLLLDPCLEATLDRLKAIAVLPASQTQPGMDPLVDTLNRLGIPLPTPVSLDSDLEDLLYLLIISPDRPSTIRIVERFKTQGGRAAVEGDPTDTLDTSSYAHQFSVMIPQNLMAEEEAMVSRLMELEKPAHTEFDVRMYWEGFLVGEARLGLDTILGDAPQYTPILLGSSALASGFLSARPPMDALDRVIADRDRVGDMPPL